MRLVRGAIQHTTEKGTRNGEVTQSQTWTTRPWKLSPVVFHFLNCLILRHAAAHMSYRFEGFLVIEPVLLFQIISPLVRCRMPGGISPSVFDALPGNALDLAFVVQLYMVSGA